MDGEEEVEVKGDPSQGGPGGARGRGMGVRSAGGHGGGRNGFLDAGNARHRDSHRSTPPHTRHVGTRRPTAVARNVPHPSEAPWVRVNRFYRGVR
ncbi:hypothetical protein GCM10018783_14860 [Streptomyces griseosporeus]|nr:hypothetical protein GCM10018783_14860 [Streptomyces griseosporeus]